MDNIQRRTDRTAENIVSMLKQSAGGLLDYEYIERDGVVHTSRLVPDDQLNNFFRQKQGAKLLELPISVAKPAQISIKNPGQFDTIYFKQIKLPETLRAGEAQVEVKAIGLNAKDFYALGGKVDTKEASCTLEYSGIVERVGPNVSSVTPEDRAVVMGPSYFKTSEIVPELACYKLQDEEDLNMVCTLPVVYTTALCALHAKANIQPGESVLIHSGAGGVGIATIQLAQQAGAEVYTTVSTDEKEWLVKKLGVKGENTFSSRDTSFIDRLLRATSGRGVDMVFNSLTGDLLHASWRCSASFGRFVEIGKRDLPDAGRLEMDQL